MEHVKHEALETIKRNNRSIKSLSIVLALALLVALFALPSSLGTLLADGRGARGHNFEVTFTKWVTDFPNLAGVVGGDVGTGTFAGEVLEFVPGDETTHIEALYHLNGGTHALTAHVFVTQDEVAQTAVITGAVTDGWLKGGQVSGNYTIISCPEQTNGLCYQGTLRISKGSERRETSD